MSWMVQETSPVQLIQYIRKYMRLFFSTSFQYSYYKNIFKFFIREKCGNFLCCNPVPEFKTKFSRKQAQNARFYSLKTSVLGLFSRQLGLYIRAQDKSPNYREKTKTQIQEISLSGYQHMEIGLIRENF
jgi:hypothetical protein